MNPTESARAAAPGPAPARRQGATWGWLWLSGFNCRAPLLVTGPLLPLVMRGLSMPPSLAGSLTSLPLLLMALVSLPGGYLGDRWGPRRLLLVSQLLIGVFGAMRGLAPDAWWELGAVAALGAAVGLAQPALAQAARAIAPARPAIPSAVYTNGFLVGSVAAAALSVPLLLPWTGHSWRAVFVCWGTLGVAAAAGWMVIGLPPLAGRSAVRAPWRELLRIRGLVPIAVVFSAQSLIFYALATWLPDYYVKLGWSLAAASAPVTAVTAGSIAGGLAAPLLLKWFGGFRYPLLIGSAGVALGVAGFLWLPRGGLIWGTAVGFLNTVPFTLGMTAPAMLAPPDRVGAAAGMLLTIGYLGSMLGPVGVGLITGATGSLWSGLLFLLAVAGTMLGIGFAVPQGTEAVTA